MDEKQVIADGIVPIVPIVAKRGRSPDRRLSSVFRQVYGGQPAVKAAGPLSSNGGRQGCAIFC